MNSNSLPGQRVERVRRRDPEVLCGTLHGHARAGGGGGPQRRRRDRHDRLRAGGLGKPQCEEPRPGCRSGQAGRLAGDRRYFLYPLPGIEPPCPAPFSQAPAAGDQPAHDVPAADVAAPQQAPTTLGIKATPPSGILASRPTRSSSIGTACLMVRRFRSICRASAAMGSSPIQSCAFCVGAI